MDKMKQCCAKLVSNRRAAERELARLARLEAYHHQKGHRNERLPDMIRSQRTVIDQAKAAIVDHEAEHCTEAPCLTASHYELRA
jgi:hypothetical protein